MANDTDAQCLNQLPPLAVRQSALGVVVFLAGVAVLVA